MTPRARRLVLVSIVGAAAIGIVFFVFLSTLSRTRAVPADRTRTAASAANEAVTPADAPATDGTGAVAQRTGSAADAPAGDGPPAEGESPRLDGDGAAVTEPPAPDRPPLVGLTSRAPDRGTRGLETPTQALGSLDPAVAPMQVRFSRAGAGIEAIVFADIWERARDKHRADRARAAQRAGRPADDMPPDEARYQLVGTRRLANDRMRTRLAPVGETGIDVPELALNDIVIDGQTVNLLAYNRDADGNRIYIWSETGPGRFETEVVDADGRPIVAIERSFHLGAQYDLTVTQRVRNLSGRPLSIRLSQYGPGDLRVDRSRYIDRRRYRFGYLVPAQDPQRLYPQADDTGVSFDRSEIVKRDDVDVWPNARSVKQDYELSWFGVTNRYFAFCVHPIVDRTTGAGSRRLQDTFVRILHEKADPVGENQDFDKVALFTYLVSADRTLPADGELAFDFGAYTGPLERSILNAEPTYTSLGMGNLILYRMSDWCAMCTFQWLAVLLLNFLALIHDYAVFDWGVAIIVLVVIVRALLHPITRKSQINMQRFGRRMAAMKPEIDRLKKKYGDDQKRFQQEQMRLMREHGVNPLHMLGCLPLFLQTPIWFALYAMLYFAFDLRHEAAFYGIFQAISGGSWAFLADLSAADHFLGELEKPVNFLFFNITGINVLPVLMGIIFFVQQKYLTPPPSAAMTPEQIQQQKIMRVMFVVLLPVMLYGAPAGLTLYMITSSLIGIIESRYIRNHITQQDLEPTKKEAERQKKPSRFGRDAQSRAMRGMLERAQEREAEKRREKERRFKKRR